MSQESGRTATRERPGETGREQGGSQRPGGRGELAGKEGGGQLITPTGRTTIANGVVSKVAGVAAREIGGVHAMGAGMGRTFGSVRERIPGMSRSTSQGVSVEVGERQAAVDIDLVVDYGVSIPDLAGAVRENVIRSVEHMCGLEVVEVNVAVDDIHLPGDEDEQQDGGQQRGESQEPRVQ